MSGAQAIKDAPNATELRATPTTGCRWYAIQTRHRHERRVEARLKDRGFVTFLPVAKQVRRWSDRWKEVELPLFPCYSFVRIAAHNEVRVAVLQTPGVVRLVGTAGSATPIPDKQIEDIQKVLTTRSAVAVQPYCAVGQRVRITGGCLDGVEGVVQGQQNSRTLLIAIEPLKRSVTVELQNYQVVPL